uniref:FimV N-terminal domain-containing protein n=1 Tax=Candidatus Kentrum sp. MB TaxID=2138164 RepID=A0A450XVB7_9GAMM|nr:MAG: FimV N-terminal domain-containing protein [Candidatus Kentron sp. MB]VFK76110.1 MAG: FimV N-terminal domain-containing protein [Candidatus Kentron sp. MB]
MRKSIFALMLLFFIPTAGVHALGLMDISLSSEINQPLEARIPLRALQADDMDTMRIKVADADHFTRANLERLPILDRLRFQAIQPPKGAAYIRITTDEAVNDPFLSFIVEVSWSRGRILREYTLLLDPPTYTGAASATVREAGIKAADDHTSAPAKAAKSSTTKTSQTPATTKTSSAPASTPAPAAADGKSDGAESLPSYGPVTPKDTLWSIATRFRPDKSVSMEQMMLALRQHNPEAFSQNNINTLKAGAILRIPNPNKTKTVSQDKALAEVQRQHAAWEKLRQKIATKPAATPKGSPVPSAETKVDATEPRQSGRVEILSAGTAEEGVGQVGKNDIRELRAEISLVKEEIDAKSRENKELRSRLAEAEDLIQEFVHLMEIQSDEINALKKKLMETRAEAESTTPHAETEPKPESKPKPEPESEASISPQDTPKEDTGAPREETEIPADSQTETAGAMETEREESSSLSPLPLEPAREIATPIDPPPETVQSKSDSDSEDAFSFSLDSLDEFMGRIHDNMILIVAGLGGLLILIGGWILWLRRRREIAEGDGFDGISLFPQDMEMDGQTSRADRPIESGYEKDIFATARPQGETSRESEAPLSSGIGASSGAEKPSSFTLGASPDIVENIASDAGIGTTGQTASETTGEPAGKVTDTLEEKGKGSAITPAMGVSRESDTGRHPSTEWTFDFMDEDIADPSSGKTEKTKTAEGENLDFGFDLESPHEPERKDDDIRFPNFPPPEMSGIDETQTQLDLAQAYIDMGDTEGARNILDKVLLKKEGEKYQALARELLEKIS